MLLIRRSYLLVYNLLQFYGWCSILYYVLKSFFQGVSVSNLYASVSDRVELFQTLAVLEIVHAAFGIVRSPFLTTAIQVVSRLFIVWPVTHNIYEARTSSGAFIFTLAWSLTEAIRYPYYAVAQIGKPLSQLTWLRYTLFYALYPLGVTGELMTIFASITPVKQRKLSSLEMPNQWNFSFNFYYVLYAILPLYLILFPKMYTYMIKQRKKVLVDYQKKLS